MNSKRLKILKRGQHIPAEHHAVLTERSNDLRRVTGDQKYITADVRSGTMMVRWIGPTTFGGSAVRRFKVKSSADAYLVCKSWDGTDEGAEDYYIARSFPDAIDYPADTVIFATQPIGGTSVTATIEDVATEVTWLDMRLTVGQFFPVIVFKDGGSNGTGSTAASFTYTVKTMQNITLGTGIELAKPRPNGAVTAYLEFGLENYGVAFYNAGGDLLLWDAGEIPQTEACS